MINGNQLRDAYLSAANNIAAFRQEVDALNVFPVPDGDTGTNMSMTIKTAVPELKRMTAPTVAAVAKTAASALLRGARGNSGVILSLLFRGFSKGLAGKEEADGADLARALQIGTETAYKAVMKPTEGTILTVLRMAAKRAQEVAASQPDVVTVWEEVVKESRRVLQLTPDMLPVLKKAGVVDAGGKGLVIVFEGMLSVFRDGVIVAGSDKKDDKPQQIAESAVPRAGEDTSFSYSAEFTVQKSGKNTDYLKLHAYLESIGDSVEVVDDDQILKCHVHTNHPGLALEKALRYGKLGDIKIENTDEECAAAKSQSAKENPPEDSLSYVPPDPDVPYGVVAVAAGEGIQDLFRDLGANQIVSGGQTMNPSTQDILRAVQAVAAKNVFVLPNNKNIIMAGEQAVRLADRNVCVLPSRTVPQGIAALLAFDAELDFEQYELNMADALETVSTGVVTFAARDSDFDGQKIRKGELLAMNDGRLAFTETDIVKTCTRLLKQMLTRDSSFVTIYYGKDVSPETAAKVESAVRQRLPDDVELTVINGGQPVYYFIISVE